MDVRHNIATLKCQLFDKPEKAYPVFRGDVLSALQVFLEL